MTQLSQCNISLQYRMTRRSVRIPYRINVHCRWCKSKELELRFTCPNGMQQLLQNDAQSQRNNIGRLNSPALVGTCNQYPSTLNRNNSIIIYVTSSVKVNVLNDIGVVIVTRGPRTDRLYQTIIFIHSTVTWYLMGLNQALDPSRSVRSSLICLVDDLWWSTFTISDVLSLSSNIDVSLPVMTSLCDWCACWLCFL